MGALNMSAFIPAFLRRSFGPLTVLAVFFFFEGCFGGIGGFSDSANRFIEDVGNAQYDRAYEQMSDAYRLRVSRTRFQEAVSGHPNLRGAREGHFRKLTVHGGSATLTGVLKTDAGDVPTVFYFSRNAEQWAIDGVTISGLPAVP